MAERSLKSGWTWVKFGDVVHQVKDKIDAQTSGLKRYIAGEHMDTDDLRLRRWGEINDDYLGPAFHMRFKPGQVLYGSRRTYLRKVAVAHFEGICANTTFVLEPQDPNILLPELLPFIMQTEQFHDFSIKNSKGSVNPYINFSDLAEYEFALPPLAEQRRMVELIGASYGIYEKISEGIRSGYILKHSIIDTRIRGEYKRHRDETSYGLIPSDWQLVRLNTTFNETQYGLSTAPQSEGDYPLLRMMNIEDGEVVENDLKYVDLLDNEFQNYRLEKGDVLFNRTNSYELVGRTGIYNIDGDHVFASYLVRVKTDPAKLLPEYLVAYLNSSPGRQQVLSFATRGVSQTNVNASNLGRVLIPLPPIQEQVETVSLVQSLRSGIRSLETRRERSFQIYKMMSQRLLT